MLYSCIALGLIPLLIGCGLLFLRQKELGRQVTAAEQTVVDAKSLYTEQHNEITLLISNAKMMPTSDKSALSAVQQELSTSLSDEAKQLAAIQQDDQAHTDAITRHDDMFGIWFSAGGIFAAWLVAVALACLLYHGERRRIFENRRLLAELAEQEPGDPFDLQVMWNDTSRRLKTYHKLVLNYASSTRLTTIATLVVGFAFLLISAVVTAFVGSTAAAVASSVASASGAALTGFVANAVLRNAETSSREVNSFFAHPLEVERTLMAERIITTLPKSAREKAKLLLIRSMTRQALAADNADQALPGSGASAAGGTSDSGSA